MKATITNGMWRRRVPWEKSGNWRTDVSKRVLSDSRLKIAEFLLKNGPTVRIPVAELRRAVEGGSSHHVNNQIWGPFNINPADRTVNGRKVRMKISPATWASTKKG